MPTTTLRTRWQQNHESLKAWWTTEQGKGGGTTHLAPGRVEGRICRAEWLTPQEDQDDLNPRGDWPLAGMPLQRGRMGARAPS